MSGESYQMGGGVVGHRGDDYKTGLMRALDGPWPERKPIPVEDVRPLGGMTVAELIAKLQKAPRDALILMNDNECGHDLNANVYQFEGRVYRFDECDKWWSYHADKYDMQRDFPRVDERPQTFVIISEFSEDGEEL